MAWDLGLSDVHPLMFPGLHDEQRAKEFQIVLSKYASDSSKRCLQVGSTGAHLGPNFIALDLYDKRPCIDVHEDLAHTSFQSESFDFIVCNAILEHVTDPFGCSKEMFRITKPGAEVWVEVPFVQPYHPTKKKWELSDGLLAEGDGEGDFNHGGDYWRFTPQGIVTLMKPFRHKELFLCGDGGIVYYGMKS